MDRNDWSRCSEIRIQYHNNVYDIVSSDILQRLIDDGKIKRFYRYSEKRWISVGVDPVRKGAQVLAPYSGPESRAPQTFETPFSTDKSRLIIKDSRLTKSGNILPKLKR